MVRKFSESELAALEMCRSPILSSHICDTTEVDVFGNKVPGWRVFRKLEREGYLFETEEDPIDVGGEPFTFTSMVCLTAKGETALAQGGK